MTTAKKKTNIIQIFKIALEEMQKILYKFVFLIFIAFLQHFV